jgi:FixJ family two-component response regulator
MSTESPIVLVVDDEPSICSSLRRLLQAHGFNVRTFGSVKQLFAHGRPSGPCCLILDVRMPGCDGITFHEQLIKAGIRVSTIFLTGHGDISMSVRAIKSGAVDFLLKPYVPAQLLQCVKSALEQDARSLNDDQHLAEIRGRYETLTSREREIYVAVASGLLNKQIAFHYGISEKTVKVHRAHVMEKMRAETSVELVRMADLLELPCERGGHQRTAVTGGDTVAPGLLIRG